MAFISVIRNRLIISTEQKLICMCLTAQNVLNYRINRIFNNYCSLRLSITNNVRTKIINHIIRLIRI